MVQISPALLNNNPYLAWSVAGVTNCYRRSYTHSTGITTEVSADPQNLLGRNKRKASGFIRRSTLKINNKGPKMILTTKRSYQRKGHVFTVTKTLPKMTGPRKSNKQSYLIARSMGMPRKLRMAARAKATCVYARDNKIYSRKEKHQKYLKKMAKSGKTVAEKPKLTKEEKLKLKKKYMKRAYKQRKTLAKIVERRAAFDKLVKEQAAKQKVDVKEMKAKLVEEKRAAYVKRQAERLEKLIPGKIKTRAAHKLDKVHTKVVKGFSIKYQMMPAVRVVKVNGRDKAVIKLVKVELKKPAKKK